MTAGGGADVEREAFERGVKAARDVVQKRCWGFQEEMMHSDGASSYTRDGEEITQGLYWDIDALLSKACCVPPSGWRCTRTAGHEGPCAAVPTEDGFPASPDPAAIAELIAADKEYDEAYLHAYNLADSRNIASVVERYLAAKARRASALAALEGSNGR